MAWSTRQLADLAGVTLRAIRHWHEVGLLPAPERLTNGYKQYTAKHLVLALRIARLSSLGFGLDRIAEILESDARGIESLSGLRTELDNRIADLSRIRADVDELIARGMSPDLSPEALLAVEALGSDPGSRNTAILLARLLAKDDMAEFARVMREAPKSLVELNAEVLALPGEASEEQISALVTRGVSVLRDFLHDQQDRLPQFDGRIGEQDSADAMTVLMTEHMNTAQQRVMSLIVEELS